MGEPRKRGRAAGRRALAVVALLTLAWLWAGARMASGRPARPAPPPGELRGAYHVHTSKSDGRGSLDRVLQAARAAGLQFLVIADHNVMSPEDAGWQDGVLVVESSEISSPYGHVVGLGMERALTREERLRDALGAIRELGGRAVLAHPFHPRRPFTRWGRGDWVGFEAVSSDSFWGWAIHDGALRPLAEALLALPFDPARAVLAFYVRPERELARFDELNRVAPGSSPPTAGPRHPLLCANDAHGWPSYRASFEAFSMHVPVTPTGDGAADGRAVIDRLLDGSAFCVFDGVAPASGVRLSPAAGGDRVFLLATTPDPAKADFRLFVDGAPVGAFERSEGGGSFSCGGRCPRGMYRVEGTWDGRPWIFTNPVWME